MKVSIIIPAYNAYKYLRATLDSIKEEVTHEIIIVDDGSDDSKSAALLKELTKSDKYKVLHKKNGGSASARNFGAKHAQGEYLLFLDADDLIQENFCTIMAKVLDAKPKLSFCYPNEVLFGSRIGYWQIMDYDPQLLKYYQYFMVTSLMRKSFFETLGGFDEDFKYLEDREFWVRAATRGFVGQKVEVMHFYRHHKLSKTSSVNKTKIMNAYERQIHQKFRKYYKARDYFNKKVLFYSAYIKFFYLVPQKLKDYLLLKGLRKLNAEHRDQISQFPSEVKADYKDVLD